MDPTALQVHIYIYMSIHRCEVHRREGSWIPRLSRFACIYVYIYIYIYVYICVCACVCVCVYIYKNIYIGVKYIGERVRGSIGSPGIYV